jgi:hypothetical protein
MSPVRTQSAYNISMTFEHVIAFQPLTINRKSCGF